MEIKTLNEQIERLKELILKCYGAVAGKNGTVPEVGERNMENLPASISSIEHLDPADLDAAWDSFKGNTGMIPKEEQTIGNLKYAIRMNQEEMEPNEINFVDFNGLVLSMTIEEVMQLTEMPKPNEYYNLTFEHWTKTLEEIQDGRCHTVGATYHTTDGCIYYVVSIPEGGGTFSLHVKNDNNTIVNWGDGFIQDGKFEHFDLSHTHHYEKGGTYVIKITNLERTDAFLYKGYGNLKEAYFPEHIDRSTIEYRNCRKLTKMCIPDNGIGVLPVGYNLEGVNKLESFVYGASVLGGVFWTNIGKTPASSLKYLVADGFTGGFTFGNMTNLMCLSVKNISSIEQYNDFLCLKLKNVVFDKVVTINGNVFTTGGLYNNKNVGFLNKLSIVDLPETIESIGNNAFTMGVDNVYIRCKQVPQLSGVNVFSKRSWYTPSCIIHVRKDATYTDAEGNTYTGLDAYANATNWANLYATNTYYTFIADL